MLPHPVEDLDVVAARIRAGDRYVIVAQSEEYPGELLFQATTEHEQFVRDHLSYLSPYCLLSELFMLGNFVDLLESEGWHVAALPSATPIVEQYRDWTQPLEVDGLRLSDGLYPFQQFALRRAIAVCGQGRARRRGFFYNFGTGTGKSVVAAAGMQELVVNRQQIDLCLCFTLKRNRINMARQVEVLTSLPAIVVEGTKDRRRRLYSDVREPCCLLLNYEKAHFDHEELLEVVRGKRVLFVFDEVQKIVRGENTANRARKGMNALMQACRIAMAWAMSASVVKSSPLRYHDIYELFGPNPLGTRKAFVARYCDKVEEYQLRPGVVLKNYRWNLGNLAEVRHIVSARTQAVRKTDPGVREYFKGMTTQVIHVQRSPEEERLREKIMEDASRFVGQINFTFSQHYNCLRYLCNTPAALAFSVSEVADRVFHANPALVGAPSTKFEMIADKIEDIRDQGDQVLVFTQWTYLTLFLFAKELNDRGIGYVTHWGGQSSADAQQAQDSFKSNSNITVFLSSDAGAFGLNFQNARFVINIECPYDSDVLMQRNDRIDRADSYLDGLTSYIYVVEDSVEERIWAINEERRRISSAVQGTAETLSRFSAQELAMTEAQAMRNLIFGSSLTPR